MLAIIAKKISRIRELIIDRKYFNLSYSQEGEDMVLRKYFLNKNQGFYIDIGAHHPKRFSNTYFFYKLGWRGINIDAMPGSMKSFDKIRSRDINIEKAISNVDKELTYFIFNEPALNGFSEEISEERHTAGTYQIVNKIEIRTEKIAHILDKYLPKEITSIDFMSIDVEGLDLDVLKSNDWNKYRPKVILVELLSFDTFDSDPIFIFLNNNGYKFLAKTYFTFLFVDKSV